MNEDKQCENKCDVKTITIDDIISNKTLKKSYTIPLNN